MNQVTIRKATIDDIDGIAALEECCFSVPWSRQSLYRDMTENGRALYFVAEISGQVAGYVGLWTILDEGQINNVAVLPRYRRAHVGSALIRTMLQNTEEAGIHSHTLEVRAGNQPAIGLYEKFGFRQEGLRKGYYEDNGEDAIIMWRRSSAYSRQP
jgi:ribosomal-protein-alanine N-acetyltransferase